MYALLAIVEGKKYSDMLNMKALVEIWIFYGIRALVISFLVVLYLKGIWISMEYMLKVHGVHGVHGGSEVWRNSDMRKKTQEKEMNIKGV